MQVCWRRIIGNKDQCIQQIVKYLEQGELQHWKRSHELQMEECYVRFEKNELYN